MRLGPPLLRLDDFVALGAEAGEAHLDYVAGLQVTRRLCAMPTRAGVPVEITPPARSDMERLT